jgi:hypothetical protein
LEVGRGMLEECLNQNTDWSLFVDISANSFLKNLKNPEYSFGFSFGMGFRPKLWVWK